MLVKLSAFGFLRLSSAAPAVARWICRRDRLVQLDLPPIGNAKEISAAMATIFMAIGEGKDRTERRYCISSLISSGDATVSAISARTTSPRSSLRRSFHPDLSECITYCSRDVTLSRK